MSDEPPEKNVVSPVRFTAEVSLGQVIQVLAVIGTVWTASYFVASQTTRIGASEVAIASLKADFSAGLTSQKLEMTAQTTALQLSMNDNFKSLRLDIANMPDMRAEVTQLGKRADGFDSRLGALSERNTKAFEMMYQMSSRMDAIDARAPPSRR